MSFGNTVSKKGTGLVLRRADAMQSGCLEGCYSTCGCNSQSFQCGKWQSNLSCTSNRSLPSSLLFSFSCSLLPSTSPSWVLGCWPGTPYRTNSSSSCCFPCALRHFNCPATLHVDADCVLPDWICADYFSLPILPPFPSIYCPPLPCLVLLKHLSGRRSGILARLFPGGSTLEGTLPPPPCTFLCFHRESVICCIPASLNTDLAGSHPHQPYCSMGLWHYCPPLAPVVLWVMTLPLLPASWSACTTLTPKCLPRSLNLPTIL